MKHKYKIGDKVIYDGLLAIVEGSGNFYGGGLCYDLVSVEDPELTCTGDENKVELYNGEEIDQQPALNKARLESHLIAMTVDDVTDKYAPDNY